MESPQPPIKPEIVINRTLPLYQQEKLKFQRKIDSLKEELSFHQNQLNSFKTALSSYQEQTNKDHKYLKKLNNVVKGLIKDQDKTNSEFKTDMKNLDSEQLNINELIKMLAESATRSEERIKKIEQKNNTEQLHSPIPRIVITEPDDAQKDIITRSNFQQYTSNELAPYDQEINEEIEKIKDCIGHLTTLTNAQEAALEKNEENILNLAHTLSLLTDSIKINIENVSLLRSTFETEQINSTKTIDNLTSNAETNQLELQTLKNTIEQQNQSISSIRNVAIASSTISVFSLLMWLWYYTNK